MINIDISNQAVPHQILPLDLEIHNVVFQYLPHPFSIQELLDFPQDDSGLWFLQVMI